MSAGELPCYTLIHVPNDADLPNEAQLKEKFEKGSDKEKTDALKKLIYMIQNGEKVNQGMLMYVIRFLLPSSDHTLKKTLLIFWEVVPKTNAQGKLLQEMILVCDAYRKDLQHPNEFVRGSTLRFLCKLKEPELLEPLMPSIIGCLEHRHSYVRRNAVCAIFTIYRNFEFLIPDAPELVSNFLAGEQDSSCKRNAFMMLLHVDQARALDYLSGCINQVTQFGDILQLIIVELIYKVCHANPTERSRFIRCVYNLLQSSSAAVRYEAAGTLVTLSAAPAAIKAAASAYIDLIVKESDNNVKLIVLDRLMELRQTPSYEKVLQELVMDILRVLSSPGLDVRQKTLSLCLDLVSSRNVEDMVMFLKKEIAKSTSEPAEEAGKYRQALVKTLHSATIKFPDVAASIVPVLMEFLSDENETAAQYVLLFVREAVHKLPHLKETILHSLEEGLLSIRKPKVFMAALWILGTYCETDAALLAVLRLIKSSLGELPIVDSEMRLMEGEEPTHEENSEKKPSTKQLVTADGTYATQSAFSVASKTLNHERPPLRQFLLDGDFFLGASLATVLNKLVDQFSKNNTENPQRSNRFRAECMFILASIINFGKSGLAKQNITEDDLDRMGTVIKLLAQGCSQIDDMFVEKCKDSLELMLNSCQQDKTDEISTKKKNIIEVDKTIIFTQLSARADAGIGENLFDLSLSQALGTAPKTQKFDFSSSKLGKVVQLAGFSDPIYAEAYVNVNQYDIVLDVLVVNQTADTLQNVSLELSTVGDLKLVDKPTPITLAPSDFTNIKATVKVASTENGVIFSTISYDVRGSTSDRNCVYLQDIKIDIMDYIVPGNVTDAEFRQMWFDFEWENKVTVNTPITDLREFLQYLSSVTNMKILTGDAAIEGDCGFLAANLCAHSIFGEDALANVSIEKASPLDEGSPIIGHIRIRAKSQGMALTLGDKINIAQRDRRAVAA
ncbi:Coatomer subunit beta [Parelaphostrongylus tenuis]|uniref:Coatomer subunit beta n=1 Tax=Parelaphostrongylus tenuis TaxID=148309 RepID=A0AAD5N851_PARTN|nr:Coatomer subunit beta [Parelaphostrongylus tenuis]